MYYVLTVYLQSIDIVLHFIPMFGGHDYELEVKLVYLFIIVELFVSTAHWDVILSHSKNTSQGSKTSKFTY